MQITGARLNPGSLVRRTRHEQGCRAVDAGQAAARLKQLMAELVSCEVDGMRWDVPQQGDAPAPVQPCHVSNTLQVRSLPLDHDSARQKDISANYQCESAARPTHAYSCL